MPAMKAVRMHRTGEPGVLAVEELPRPEPGIGDVLVQVHAAGLNPPDWYARKGFSNIPEELRPTLPLPYTPGSDISGVVAAVGHGITQWQEGDEVFGLVRFPSLEMENGGRGYAEYTTSPALQLARKPAVLSHVEAAAVPMAGLTAYQYVFDHIKLDEGRRVLVNGAAGGVGHFAVQLAKLQGAYVIGVASGRHETFLRELGVDEFLDYTTTRVEDEVRDVDVLIDCVGGPDGHRFLPVLRPGGVISPVFHGDYHRSARPSWASPSDPARSTRTESRWPSWDACSKRAACASASTRSSRSRRPRRPTSGRSAGTSRGRSSCGWRPIRSAARPPGSRGPRRAARAAASCRPAPPT